MNHLDTAVKEFSALRELYKEQERKVAELEAKIAVLKAKIVELSREPERVSKYSCLIVGGSCTLRQFTFAAHKSLHNAAPPSTEWRSLFDIYFADCCKSVDIKKSATHVYGVSVYS
jgi:hypothetical protein